MYIEKIKILERLLSKKQITYNEAKILVFCNDSNFDFSKFNKYQSINPLNIQAFQ